jgi:hypothetical protein
VLRLVIQCRKLAVTQGYEKDNLVGMSDVSENVPTVIIWSVNIDFESYLRNILSHEVVPGILMCEIHQNWVESPTRTQEIPRL